MAAALSLATRRRLVKAYRNGQSYRALAQEFGVSYHTVATLCQRFDQEGEAGLRPRYDRCGSTGIRSDALLYRAALWLKRRHPRWGAPFIQLQLEQRYPDKAMPAVRTLQAWFKQQGLAPQRSKPPKTDKQWARRAHQVWQVDAKEHQKTADATALCWLTITDEYTGAVLAAPVFPLGLHQSGPAQTCANGADGRFQAVGATPVYQGR